MKQDSLYDKASGFAALAILAFLISRLFSIFPRFSLLALSVAGGWATLCIWEHWAVDYESGYHSPIFVPVVFLIAEAFAIAAFARSVLRG